MLQILIGEQGVGRRDERAGIGACLPDIGNDRRRRDGADDGAEGLSCGRTEVLSRRRVYRPARARDCGRDDTRKGAEPAEEAANKEEPELADV